MGIGYALTEDFETVDGVIQAKKNERLWAYCGSHQMPEMEVIYIEEQDPRVPARGAWRRRDRPGADGAPASAGSAPTSLTAIVRKQLPMRDSTSRAGYSET